MTATPDAMDQKRRNFLRRTAFSATGAALGGFTSLLLNGCSRSPMTADDYEQLRQRIEQRPRRVLRLEIGAPLDVAITASTPGVWHSGATDHREYVEQGIYLIDDQREAVFPLSVYRDTTPMPGFGSLFSAEVSNGPLQLVYGLGDNPITFPLAWNVNGGLIAGHFFDFEAWTYLVPMPLAAALDQLRGFIRAIDQAGWRTDHQGFHSLEEAAVLLRAAEISAIPDEGYGVGSYRDPTGTIGCGFSIKRVAGFDGPPSRWGYGCSVGFSATAPFQDKLQAIAKTARRELRFKNYDAEIKKRYPRNFSMPVEEWTSADYKIPASVELHDYLRQIRAAGLTRDLDPRWAR